MSSKEGREVGNQPPIQTSEKVSMICSTEVKHKEKMKDEVIMKSTGVKTTITQFASRQTIAH
jgi:hypothetical protein